MSDAISDFIEDNNGIFVPEKIFFNKLLLDKLENLGISVTNSFKDALTILHKNLLSQELDADILKSRKNWSLFSIKVLHSFRACLVLFDHTLFFLDIDVDIKINQWKIKFPVYTSEKLLALKRDDNYKAVLGNNYVLNLPEVPNCRLNTAFYQFLLSCSAVSFSVAVKKIYRDYHKYNKKLSLGKYAEMQFFIGEEEFVSSLPKNCDTKSFTISDTQTFKAYFDKKIKNLNFQKKHEFGDVFKNVNKESENEEAKTLKEFIQKIETSQDTNPVYVVTTNITDIPKIFALLDKLPQENVKNFHVWELTNLLRVIGIRESVLKQDEPDLLQGNFMRDYHSGSELMLESLPYNFKDDIRINDLQEGRNIRALYNYELLGANYFSNIKDFEKNRTSKKYDDFPMSFDLFTAMVKEYLRYKREFRVWDYRELLGLITLSLTLPRTFVVRYNTIQGDDINKLHNDFINKFKENFDISSSSTRINKQSFEFSAIRKPACSNIILFNHKSFMLSELHFLSALVGNDNKKIFCLN